MNETTLNALINLFALFSSVSNSKKEDATRNFSLYLHQHLGISEPGEYVNLFKELLEFYGAGEEAGLSFDLNVQIRKISTNIKSRLQKKEQVMVFLRFLELAKSGESEKADELFFTLSQVFEINQPELDKFISFIFYESPGRLTSDFLLINNEETLHNKEIKHICEKNIDGELLFLNSGLIGHYIFIFRGKEELTLEGNPILPGLFYAFNEGGIIRGSRISPVYYTDINTHFIDKKAATPFIFRGDEIEFKFKNSDNGLYRFSFSEQSGQLIAVMGGSGVGKSTLLNILNGNIPVQDGAIKINQSDIHKDKNETEGVIGYVPQDDLLFEDLTVWDNLYFNACLCFDNLTKKEIGEKITKVLVELELIGFKNLKVGSPLKKVISGGQRKRLNIALELIRGPSVLFVDEPTSGLSSTDSEKVMLLLKQQARLGKLVIVNIHQPSSAIFKLFDKLWVMDKGGRIIYTGNPLDAIIYFKNEANLVNADICECANCGNVNPEQVLEIVETKMIDSTGSFTHERRFTPQYWYSRFRERQQKGSKQEHIIGGELPQPEFEKPGIFKQFLIFLKRNLSIKFTDRQYMLINLLEAPFLALVVAYFTRFSEGGEYIFFENKSLISYLFMSIVVVLFMGMSVSAEEIVKDRKILQREAFLNLSRFSYLNSKIIFLILLSAFQTFSFVLVGNLILGIHLMNLTYWSILFSAAVFSNLLGLNISSALDSVVAIYILIPVMLIPQILLCGVIVKFDDLQSKTADKDAVPIVGDIMVSRWAFEALAVEQYKSNPYMAQFFELEKDIAQSRYYSDLLTTELIGRIDLVSGWKKQNKPDDGIEKKLAIIRNEIIELNKGSYTEPFPGPELLTVLTFNNELAQSAKAHLTTLQDFHNNRYQKLRKEKDRLIIELQKKHGSEFLYKQKMKYHNKSLEVLVLNSEAKEYYRETANGIMQKVAPIYKKPDYNNGRAHFLASEKIIMGNTFGTFAFNLMVIWGMCLFLYVALYFNWLRKILSFSPKSMFMKR